MSLESALFKHLMKPKGSLQKVLSKFRKYQVHEINLGRSEYGEYHHLFPLLKKYADKFKQYVRMNIETFNYILNIISKYLKKNWCNLHPQPILPEESLVVTLRFLATGMTYKDLGFAFRMGDSTVHGVVKRTMKILWKKLCPLHMPIPTEKDFLRISTEFYSRWNFPNCLGAIDVRHVRIKKPKKEESQFFNYKKFHSITLQAIVDANWKFISIDVGGYGRQHDSTTFFASDFYAAVKENLIKLPADAPLPGSSTVLPFYFVGDGAYPLMVHLMKPYVGRGLSKEQQIFNKRLSRARLVVECAFGRTCQKWQIFYKLLQCAPETADWIVKTTSVLHNVIIDLEGEKAFRKPTKTDRKALTDIKNLTSNNFPSGRANIIREKLRKFIMKNPIDT